MDSVPLILLIDDEDQSSTALQLRNLGVDAEWLYPTEVSERDLVDGDLLVVDEYFDLRDAPPGSADAPRLPVDLPLAVVPEDGLALSAVLRSAARSARSDRPIGICLRTGKLDELTAAIPQGVRQAWLASARDLEWVTSKHTDEHDASSGDRNTELASLGQALKSYPASWPRGSVRDLGTSWVGVPDEPWAARARGHIAQCRPPADSLSSQRSLGWLRWLAQRALPYPTFVVSEIRLAVMLGLTVESVRLAMTEPTGISERLGSARFRGPLSELQPARYWRAAIQDLSAEVVGEADADDPVLVGAALARSFTGLAELGIERPVVCIDDQYRETGRVVDQSIAERLMPDGWPAYADSVWAPSGEIGSELADLRTPRLQ